MFLFKVEHISSCTTPHRELAPPLEEEEEQCSESQSGCAPLQQIEHNISALLRGDIAVVRVGDSSQSRRSLNYRPGVHKSESAKEMLLSQNAFGPLPPSPPSSSPEINVSKIFIYIYYTTIFNFFLNFLKI